MNTKVVRAIDAFLDANNKTETTPTDVASYLDKKGILRDSIHRPGLPLRKLLRNGKIPNAHQNGNKWIILRSNFKPKTDIVYSHREETPVSSSTIQREILPDQIPTQNGIDWNWCQKHSDVILLSGLSELTSKSVNSFQDSFPLDIGNYLIRDSSEQWAYIGESNNLAKRLKQHSKAKTATFYKNYMKMKGGFSSLPQDLDLQDYRVQCVTTKIGRKELEEFGIVNLPCNLNKFQLEKREAVNRDIYSGIWKAIQNQAEPLLNEGIHVIESMETNRWEDATIPEQAGIYWIEHPDEGLIYIGESSNILKRYKAHSGKTYFSSFRRNTAENLLGFTLKEKNGKRRYLTVEEEVTLDNFIKECSLKILPVAFGRFEFEENLITKHRPLLNRKGNSD